MEYKFKKFDNFEEYLNDVYYLISEHSDIDYDLLNIMLSSALVFINDLRLLNEFTEVFHHVDKVIAEKLAQEIEKKIGIDYSINKDKLN